MRTRNCGAHHLAWKNLERKLENNLPAPRLARVLNTFLGMGGMNRGTLTDRQQPD